MIEYADVELETPHDLRVPVAINIVCVMGMDVDGQSWVPREMHLYDDSAVVMRAMQVERQIERTKVVPRILSLRVVRLTSRRSFKWKTGVVPQYRWCHWINWIHTLGNASTRVIRHLQVYNRTELEASAEYERNRQNGNAG